MATYNISDLNKRALVVTPESVVVIPGGAATLRIQSNCAWCVTSRPEQAAISRICGFGDGSLTVSSPEDVSIDGEIVFATDNESIYQRVTISSVEPNDTQMGESETESEENSAEMGENRTETAQNGTQTEENTESPSGEQPA